MGSFDPQDFCLGHDGRRPGEPGTLKDPLSSRPFAEADIALVLAAADATVVGHRDGTTDALFAGHLLRVLLTFGPHVSVLSGGVRQKTDRHSREISYREDRPLTSADLRVEGGELYLAWRRPKTGRPVLILVPADMKPWLGAFLDQPRSGRRQWYNELLERIEDRLAAMGTPIKLAPSRFRHTAAVRLRKMGLLDEDIEDMLAITPQTMRHYVNRTVEERSADLRAKGWDMGTLS